MSEAIKAISHLDIEKQKDCMMQVFALNNNYKKEYASAPKVFVLTLGCQQNEADSEKLMGMALEMGYEKTNVPDDASLIIVNTCAIREHAEKRALSLIGQYKHIKSKNPQLIIAVCGCMVVQEHRIDEIKHRYPYVDILLGPSILHKLPEYILSRRNGGRRIFSSDDGVYSFAEGLPVCRENSFKAWVSVMYGCNNFCSYCIVPYVRGRERSRKKEDVISEVKQLVADGYKDITLLGQNVNSYGNDFGSEYDFADLLYELDQIEGDYILHFMTSHPKNASKKLIDVMANSKHIARHFHLPMQSGSTSVLKAMNRRYSIEKYMDILDYIREKMPECTVSSDIIVGFPTETDSDFEETLKALKRARFDMIFSFLYSPRKGTPAAEMEQIPQEIKQARFERMLTLQNDIALEKNKTEEGKVLRILCEGESKNDATTFYGRSEGGKIVFFEPCPENIGKFVNVKIERGDTFALYGKII